MAVAPGKYVSPGPPTILAWASDPGPPDAPNDPVRLPVPVLDTDKFRFTIDGPQPEPAIYRQGTDEFRYWAAAEALRRAADMWAALVPDAKKWSGPIGTELVVRLNEGERFDAAYDRTALHFYRETVDNVTVYSAESPDIACHELAHAVLDRIRPQLFHAGSIETAAFHESFGDISAILAALQLESVRDTVLIETNNNVYRSSTLSRIAEQFGWAVRRVRPDLTDRDCFRNAVNSFFYRDPSELPPGGPAAQLSSEPHSFSRVFTGAFFRALAEIFEAQEASDSDSLLTAAEHAAQLLVAAVQAAPVVPSYFSQVAASMIAADGNVFGGRYAKALRSGFVEHGILSREAAVNLTFDAAGASGKGEKSMSFADDLQPISLPRTDYGLTQDLQVDAASHPLLYGVSGATSDVGSAVPQPHDHAARSFVEDLFRCGRIDAKDEHLTDAAVAGTIRRKTHRLVAEGDALVLKRILFDCGFPE